MTLSVIIVNYRSACYILDLLESFQQQENDFDYEIIIVDNQSNDDSKVKITTAYPSVLWIDMGYNAGFARANNAGIDASNGEIVLLLNPDTLVVNQAVEKCFKKFINTKYVACGVQLLNPDFTLQISGSYFMTGGLNHLLPLPYWGRFLRKIALLVSNKKTVITEASSEEKVDWISGAFLMVKKSAIKICGKLDPDFFLYGEEVEWCGRLGKVGELCIFGDIQMVHIIGQTINSETETVDKSYFNLYDKKGLQLMVSNHVRVRKQYGVFWFLFQLFNFTFAIPVFLFGGLIDHAMHGKPLLQHLPKLKGMAKNVLKVWRLAPVIIVNKPYFYKVL